MSADHIPIWVINLERAEDRRHAISTSLDQLGLPFELILAYDGLALTEAQQRSYSRARSMFTIGRGLGLGELGCALSHRLVYERMVVENVPRVLVVEDDAIPNADLVAVLDELDAAPEGWDVITFHSLFASAMPEPIDARLVRGRFRICQYRGLTYGAQCYLVCLKAAHRLIDVGLPIRMPADDLLFRPRPAGLTVYGFIPNVVGVADHPSDIHARTPSGPSPDARVHEEPLRVAGKVYRRLRG